MERLMVRWNIEMHKQLLTHHSNIYRVSPPYQWHHTVHVQDLQYKGVGYGECHGTVERKRVRSNLRRRDQLSGYTYGHLSPIDLVIRATRTPITVTPTILVNVCACKGGARMILLLLAFIVSRNSLKLR